MPRVSTFYGIVIAMYFDEHGVPHFHARYAGERASVAIATLEVLAGVAAGASPAPRARVGGTAPWRAGGELVAGAG